MKFLDFCRRRKIEIAFVVVSAAFVTALALQFYMLFFVKLPALEYYMQGASICV